jgi:hypothetical protein
MSTSLEGLLGNVLGSSGKLPKQYWLDEAKLDRRYYGKAKRLAKKLGLWIEIDNVSNGFGEPVSKGQWICGDSDFYKSLPHVDDGFFSTSWSECHDNLLAIQDELSKLSKE